MANCRSCGAEIIWLKTKAGKNMPVDLPHPGAIEADTVFDSDRHISHFARCPNADEHRKPR